MKKFLISFTLILVIIISTFFIFDHKNRFFFFKSIIPAYNIFKLLEVRTYLRIRNFERVSESINSQISLSKKYGKNKTGFTNGIYDVMKLVYQNVIFQDEYIKLEQVAKEWYNLHPDIYDAKIFYAKTLFEINIKGKKRDEFSIDKINKIRTILDEAIEISDSREEAYRIGFNLGILLNSGDDLNFYCKKYQNSFFGGTNARTHTSLFESYSIGKLGLNFNSNQKEILLGDNFVLNKLNTYEFNFLDRKDINQFNLIIATLPGIIIDFNKVILFSSKEKFILDPKDFIITSKNGYNIDIQNNFTSFILTSENVDEVISFNTKKKFSNIEKLSIKMKFRRADILNKNNYQSLDCIE